jgi:CDP-paratose 2-epimerase
VLDYARTFGLPAAVFRMSCIYGPHQFGTEDQGWVAHFVIQALQDAALTLYGDGLQVRDVLFVDDLVDAMMAAHDHIDRLAGQAFNIGGGTANTISLLELIDLIGDLFGRRPSYRLEHWRRADQRYYVSDIAKFAAATGWMPRVPLDEGVERLAAWFVAHGVSVAPAGLARTVAS